MDFYDRKEICSSIRNEQFSNFKKLLALTTHDKDDLAYLLFFALESGSYAKHHGYDTSEYENIIRYIYTSYRHDYPLQSLMSYYQKYGSSKTFNAIIPIRLRMRYLLEVISSDEEKKEAEKIIFLSGCM